ncbi:MAG TPA: M23 family metallopeptidase [Gemmatimonadaceae bacterium]|jgi:murein DD-endopeptidase MepM/ murein hydrolase activator NlpD|nr:M23 family metallopeptidase [Gemmatimonadaceae bacterium]
MRRHALSLLFTLVAAGCARQVIGAPSPSAPRPRAQVARSEPTGIGALSSSETVNYILARGLLVPVAGVAVSQLQDSFDEGRDGERVHRALDILAPRGTPVLAADDGRILRVRPNTLGGNTVYATDPQGRVVYYYAHLDAYQPGLTEGATIARGDTLGIVGTTGNAPKDTPHLHFQVMQMPSDGRYWDGTPINPYPLFLLLHAARP